MTTKHYIHDRTDKHNTGPIGSAVMIIVLIGLICFAFNHALNRSIENQDTMLCNSAKVSGNLEYLDRCQCFYDTNDIKCIQYK